MHQENGPTNLMVGIVKPVFSNWAKSPNCSQSSFTWVDPLPSPLQTNLISLTLAFYQTRRAPHILNSIGPAGRAAVPVLSNVFTRRGERETQERKLHMQFIRWGRHYVTMQFQTAFHMLCFRT